MEYTKKNSLRQWADVPGPVTENLSRALVDESVGKGIDVPSRYGSSARVVGFSANIVTISGLSGMTPESVGRFLEISGAANQYANGLFLICTYFSETSVGIFNKLGTNSDSNNGNISWKEVFAYSMADEFDFLKIDRKNIKGTPNYWSSIPTYRSLKDTNLDIEANLFNLAGKTTDAIGFFEPILYKSFSITAGAEKVTINSVGNLPQSTGLIDKTGVPVFDMGAFAGNFNACYVKITYNKNENQVATQDGYTLIGMTKTGTSNPPDSVDIYFYKVKLSDGLDTAVPCTWDPVFNGIVDLEIPYLKSLYDLDENIVRRQSFAGNSSDADLRYDVNNLVNAVGADGDQDISAHLTHKENEYAFNTSPTTATSALNRLNEVIGDKSFTGDILVADHSIADNLQQLSDSIELTGYRFRITEILEEDVFAFTPHPMPFNSYYTPDPTYLQANLMIFINGYLQDPGVHIGVGQYYETDMFHVTFFNNIKAGNRIDYIIKKA